MLEEHRTSSFQILAISIPNWVKSRVPVAACKAGFQGILDLEFADIAVPAVRNEIETFRDAVPGGWGVKLCAAALAGFVDSDLIDDHGLGCVVLTGDVTTDVTDAVEALRAAAANVRVLVEVISESGLDGAEDIQPDGLIAKGNESGGRSGDETSFILLQRLIEKTDLPIIAQGGVGPDTVAAFAVCGAAGVALDWQLAMFEAAQTPAPLARALSRMDGSETFYITGAHGDGYRVFWRADHTPARELKTAAETNPAALAAAVHGQVDPVAGQGAWLVGQDAGFARSMVDRYGRLGPALEDLKCRATRLVSDAQRMKPLGRGSVLAQTLGTEFPIIQGPMTRVSDRPEFALAVAEGGGLPFLALALMRGAEAVDLVADTKALLGDRPWGVGILGFVDDALREEQMKIVVDHAPDFALIAGGRPEQALSLERAGIPTFLHVPSPGLLSVFLQQGARRFIFEGRECGGHVGPRSSSVLWQQAIDELRAFFGDKPMDCQVLFAGGIHDARSGAMVSAMAADIAAQGAEVGALVGSAYIVTREAVETEAVLSLYQDMVIEAGQTMLLESGVGHATRVVQSPIVDGFQAEKSRLIAEGLDPETIKDQLERFNVGRSRVASKGIDRNPAFGQTEGAAKYITISEDDQRELGVYMIGQVAGLKHAATTIAQLHADISDGAGVALDAVAGAPTREEFVSGPGARVAVTGIATILPKAPDRDTYWQNILDKVDGVSEIPDRRWDWRRYYDADKSAPDKTYSRWGGFVDELEFDPISYGIPPNSMPHIEPLQLLALEVVRKALEDAGFKDGIIPDAELRRRTCVIIGVGGGAAPLGQQYAVRTSMPAVLGDLPDSVKDRLPEWTEDSFPGILLNVIAGRVANRFDLGGVNFTVDAACGSSLAAVQTGLREIEVGTADMAIVAGVDAFMSPFDFIAFAKTQALSEKGRCRTFDAGADGIAISEGLAALVLRPLEAAEAAGDRIYAVVRGVAGASDGRDLSLTAPRPEGQQETLRRAYQRAGISPATVGLIEAHGTGTVVGDRTEIQSLSAVFGTTSEDKQFCGVGSVKSMIGHTKAAAGCAGMAKIALALHHRVLPPTLNVETPNESANFPESPFFPVTELRPWMRTGDTPRRAGVSAFGFGGTNFHAVMEEYEGGYLPSHQEPLRQAWAHELLLFSADDATALAADLRRAADALGTTDLTLADIAASLAKRFDAGAGARLSLVASCLTDAVTRLRAAADNVAGGDTSLREIDPMGTVFTAEAALRTDQIGFLFPGQGSQYPGMAAGLTMHFPAMRRTLEAANACLRVALPSPLADAIYPRPTLDADERKAQVKALMQTNVAQPAIGAVSSGILGLLRSMGAEVGAVAGHSFGELTALSASGAMSEPALWALAHARGDAIIREGGGDLGTMTAVSASESRIREVLGDLDGITFANFNAPEQTVLAGSSAAMDRAEAALSGADVSARRLPVACAFHSDFVAPASERLAEAIAGTAISAPCVPVYANESGAPYPNDAGAVADMLTRHLTQPVNFMGAVREMHSAGVRLFIEVGPNAVLSRLTKRILGDVPHLAVATDVDGRDGVQQFLVALGAMSVGGMDLDLSQLWAQRAEGTVDVTDWTGMTKPVDPRRGLKWMLDPARVRPIDGQVAKVGLAGRMEDDPNLVPAADAAAQAAAMAATPIQTAAVPTMPMGQPVPMAPLPAGTPRQPSGQMVDAMRRHHELMGQMLASHAQTMQMFLHQSGQGAAPSIAPIPNAPAAPFPAAAPTPIAAATPAVAKAAPAPVPAPVASGPVRPNAEAVAVKLLELIADRTGYPPEMLGRELNLEADLGIDSIKRVEILASLRLAFLADAGDAAHEKMGPVARERTVDGIVAKFMEVADSVTSAPVVAAPVPAAPTATGPARPDPEAVAVKLLELIADRTGYPPEMLGRELNLEADLGIDSIKRVEILASLRLAFLADAGDVAHEKMGPVARERTVDGIVAKFMEVADSVTSAPVVAAPVPAAPTATGPARPDPEAVAVKLLELIADRTGYPPEMLGRELNLEADLGIDSIKRVEILASLRLAFLADAGDAAHEKMGPVARERTVDGIVAKFMEVADSVTSAAPVTVLDVPANTAIPEFTVDGVTRRFVMEPMAVEAAAPALWVTTGALYLITDDGTGVAKHVADRVTAAGGDPLILDPHNLSVETVVTALGARMADLAGVLHCASILPPLDGTQTADDLAVQARRAVQSLFLVLSATGDVLLMRTDAVVLAASRMGGLFGFDGTTDMAPGAAGAAGLLKTVDKEWDQAHVRALDLAADCDAATAAGLIFDEAGRPDDAVEIGWSDGQRWKLRAAARPIDAVEGPADQPSLTAESVVLVTGGARGITARCLLWLAQKYRSRFILAGSSPAPVGEESPDTVGIADAMALRAHLARAARDAGRALAIPEIERRARALLKDREIRATLRAIEATGAKAEYHACDVRDRASLSGLIDTIRTTYGAIDGAIHGAGIIEDQLVTDKTLDSFRRVISTKAESAFLLAELLTPEELKFTVFFTSVAGRFGNRGQGDYGAANEIVSKYARHLDHVWPGRVVAISWGPWDSDGMVSDGIKAQFEALGIEAVDPAVGIRALESEILTAEDRVPEVVWGLGPWAQDMAERPSSNKPVKAAE